MTEIVGTPQPQGGNPVALRAMQIWGTTLGDNLGVAATPVYGTFVPGSGTYFWQYYQVSLENTTINGMIVCEIGGCPCVLYGPIYDYYDSQQQFEGPLGFPTSDVTQRSDGSYYAVFDNGVLYADTQGNVSQLHALSPSLLEALTASSAYPSGINGTIGQITQIAQQKVQSIANNAVQTNAMLSMYVSSIAVELTFKQVGQGACANSAALGSLTQGAVCREHVFDVYLTFNLTGCASVAGNANADMTVTLQLVVNPPGVQAFLRSYTINNVGSPFGAANGQITSQLNQAMANQFGHDLLSAPTPSGFSAIAVIVDTSGNVNVYILPTCSASAVMLVRPRLAQKTLSRLRSLRDNFIVHKRYGGDVVTIVNTIGPLLIERLRQEDLSSQGKGYELLTTVATIISAPDVEDDAFKKELDEVSEKLVRLLHTLDEDADLAGIIQHMLDIGVAFVRERVANPPSATAALKAFDHMLAKELERGTRRSHKH